MSISGPSFLPWDPYSNVSCSSQKEMCPLLCLYPTDYSLNNLIFYVLVLFASLSLGHSEVPCSEKTCSKYFLNEWMETEVNQWLHEILWKLFQVSKGLQSCRRNLSNLCWKLVFAWDHCKCFPWVVSSNPQSRLTSWVLLLSPFYKWENWGPRKFG